jgi:hypothetical protein
MGPRICSWLSRPTQGDGSVRGSLPVVVVGWGRDDGLYNLTADVRGAMEELVRHVEQYVERVGVPTVGADECR